MERRSRRRLWLLLLAAPVLAALVVGIEVVLARNGPHLEDEEGSRPVRMTVRTGPGDPLEVLWLGDSTTTGVGAEPFQSSMAHRVSVALTRDPVEMTVLGESGARVDDVIDSQLAEMRQLTRLGASFDMVFVSVGANDVTALTGGWTFRRRYEYLVGLLQDDLPDATIVLIGIPDLGTAPRLLPPLRQIAGVRASQLDDTIADIADEHGLVHVDLAARTSDAFGSDGSLFSADEYHPNGRGHAIWAQAVLASLPL